MSAASGPEVVALPIKAGDVLGGKYRIEQVLGEGGMGVVYVALHQELREPVAIKVLHPRRATDSEIVARFLREGRTAVKIRSEHVARILDVGTHDTGHIKLPYIVMELLDGQDLAHRIDSSGKVSASEAVDLVFQTCEALACAHALGIVHRDLKPSNLFLIEGADGKPFVKVLDFGISKVSDQPSPDSSRAVTTTSDVLGSPGYMSPEQMRATRDVDARSDVWSLGMILWEMLVGKPMFGTATFPEICAKVLHGNLVRPREANTEIPEGLAAVIERALATEPEQRHPTVLALAEALGPFFDGDAAPRIARVANLSRPPSDRKNTSKPPLSGGGYHPLPVATPMAIAVGPTAPATPVDPPKATTAATPTPWGVTDAKTTTPIAPKRSPVPIVAVAALAVGAIGTALYMGTSRPSAATPAPSASPSVTATASATASATATATATASASASAPASAPVTATVAAPATVKTVRVAPSAKPSATAAESAKTANGAPILR